MQPIRGILFEPVGGLAEFPAEPFLEIAARFFTGKKQNTKSGSRAYWHLLNLMESAPALWDAPEIADLETQAAAGADVYDDVQPALLELKALGVTLCLTSSLSAKSIVRFLDAAGSRDSFSAICSRTSAGGMKAAPLAEALRILALDPACTMFLTDTAEGLKAARSAGVNSILMMNDPDEAKRLAMKNPEGGIISLHELPDFVRLLRAQTWT